MAKTTRRTRSRARPTRTTGTRLDAVKAQARGMPTSQSAPLASPHSGQEPTHDQIAAMAYEIWLKSGCPQGSETQHWLEAERPLAASVSL